MLIQDATIPAGIMATVGRFTDFLLSYVAALAAVGALAMALTEAAKKLWDSRTKFHALRWTRWVKETPFDERMLSDDGRETAGGSAGRGQSAGTRAREGEGDAPADIPSRTAAYMELLQLCTGIPREQAWAAAGELMRANGHISRLHAFHPGPANAVFALDLDRMMGSIQDAADVALASPRQYPSLYLLMATGADPEDVRQWFRTGAGGMADIATIDPSPEQRRAIKDQADRFARLRQVVKRKLDGYQLYTGHRWASWNQFAANALGIVFMLFILLWMRMSGNGSTPSDLTIVLLSLLGGVLSPIAKDLVTALKQVRHG